MESTTRISLQGSSIVLRIGSIRFETYLSICKSLPVRRYDRKNNAWVIPIEHSPELVQAYDGLPNLEIDEGVLAHADRITDLALRKGKLTLPAHADLVKTACLNHQSDWLAWSKHFKSCANLSEQGTGKTKMALDWCDMKECTFVLVICRNSNVYKWASECRKHSDYRPFVLKGTRNERIEALQSAANANHRQQNVAAILNYEYVAPFQKTLQRASFDCIVLDESTAIKSTSSKRHKACVALSASTKYKLILTGTPLVNSPIDAFGQFKFLNPNILGNNFYGFKNRYVILGGYNGYEILGYKNTKELQDKIAQFSYRVLKKDCLDLPPKRFDKLDISPGKEFEKAYRDLVESTIIDIQGAKIDNTLAISKINRCLQFCDGFLYTPDHDAVLHGSPKDAELLQFMEDHFQSSHKLIIWAYFRATIDRLYRMISEKFPHIHVERAAGGTPVKISSAMVDAFNESYTSNKQKRCIILQSTAFMHGIDLLCDTAVYYSRSWSAEEWLQTQDRIHGINRGGGTSTNYILLGIRGTVEESVHLALKRKEGIAAYLLRDVDNLAYFLKGMIVGGDQEDERFY